MVYLAVLFFSFMAIQIIKNTRKELFILLKFNQSQSFAWFSLLFPVAPIIYLITVFRFGWIIAIVLGSSCFMPSLILAKKRMDFFECAGTDIVNNANKVATTTFGTAMGGLIFMAVILVYTLIAGVNA